MIDESALEGGRVHDGLGHELGPVLSVYRSGATQHPAWVTVESGDGPRFVPLRTATQTEDGVSVPFTRDVIVQAPVFDADAGNLSAEDEAELYEHYGLEHPLPFAPSVDGGPLDGSGSRAVSETPDGPLSSQAARDWDSEDADEGAYSGGPATGGHLPASDAVDPHDTWHGETVRNEIQVITDIELSGETLSPEQRAARRHGEAHAIDMEVRPDDREQR